ncbi:hypothetical protein [Ruegeria sp. HKCCD8929]|uniref:hypothetical protein n=1 Tax=Ruegeria sp. HKCCD8929 TaxID=2683006 RepID=UPI001488DFBA|nr:hypothetical protein [Ruegeria sp. HKCCD8929]
MRFALLCLSLMLSASPSWSQEALGLMAPDEVARSGLLKHILPRFSLKTGIRVVADETGPMEITVATPGDPVFRGGGVTYYLRVSDEQRQQRFRDWMLSEIGKRTIEGFQPENGPPFTASFDTVEVVEAPAFTGNAALGADLALTHCGRCHVVGPQNRMNGLGSTPSFAVLRTLPDWSDRFQQFYVLRPHGAFTQVKDVTPPFDPERPPPIVPVEITLDDLEAILAFVAITGAADLGAPLQFQ